MRRGTQKTTARLIAIPAVMVMTVAAGMLIANYIATGLHAPGDAERLKVLEALAKEDASQLPALVEERERQTEASLRRLSWMTVETNVLIAAAILFLLGVKWSMVLKGQQPVEFSKIAAQRTQRPTGRRGSNGRARPGSSEIKPCQVQPAQQLDAAFIDELIEEHGRGKSAVIPILHAIQTNYRYLPDTALKHVHDHTEITPAQIAGVSSFYSQFRHSPTGKHILKVCHGTACHVSGAPIITDQVRRHLGIETGDDTDPQGQFTVEEVACLGCCTLAPVLQIDAVTCGHMTPEAVPDTLEDFLHGEGNGAARPAKRTLAAIDESKRPVGEIRIGLGSCCVAGGSGKVFEAFEQAVAASGARATLKRVGCVGMCHQTPLVEAVLPGRTSFLYAGVQPEDATRIVRRHFRAEGIKRRLVATTSAVVDNMLQNGRRQPITIKSIEVRDPPVAAFLGRQKHIATEHSGRIDPIDLDEYLRCDGFKAIERCVKDLSPTDVIDAVRRSGLRGRGGAGYPTARKWSKVRAAGGDLKYIICNGDEGDPGAFMDRMLMESFPYRIIEGMAIAAYAVGAGEGYFYIRAEYPLAVSRIREALDRCEDRGLLGDNILGSGVALRLKIMEGAGAFVCGEETALLASIEGDRGSPRLRPPYPADSGLWGKPTLVNNVETYATVPWIMRHGAEAFAELGTATSKGTKVFSLAGKIKRGGLIEVPMGITIREIVSQIGGGMKDDRQFKAVQIGGPSGGCIPAELADTPVDYEALTEVGAIMGSGGLVVLDETDCMVDIARYFLGFTQDQSCGKCTYCRIGTRRMLDILNRLCAGDARPNDLEALEQLADVVGSASLCGLGKTAPNPVLSTLRYFRDEYEAHLNGRCPAGKCKALIEYRVTDKCVGCTLCAQHCPVEAIAYTPYEQHEIDADKCTCCDTCRARCPEDAIEVV